MIWDCETWKDDLLNYAKQLASWKTSRTLSAKDLHLLERETFIAFYSIRKLKEALKISPALVSKTIKVETYKSKTKKADHLNWHKIDELYHLDKSDTKNIKISRLINVFIHSFVFLVVENPSGGLGGFYVNSDHSKKNQLWYISVNTVEWLAKKIGNDFPASTHFERDPTTREWIRFK